VYDLPVVTSLKGSLVGGQIESGLLFVGVVTVEACVPEDRKHVVVIGDFFWKRGGGCGSEDRDEGKGEEFPVIHTEVLSD
jgi:hypothetical protein